MTAITVTGTIDNPAPTYTYTEPASPLALPAVQAGTSPQVDIGSFHNTGNVPQTVHVEIINVQGITLDDVIFHINGTVANEGPTGVSVTLQPDELADLAVNITAPNTGPGDDTSYSFEIDTTWTH